MSITSGSHQFKLVVIYRPQVDDEKHSTTASFFKEFPELLESVLVDSTRFIIGGDFNFHWDVETDHSTIRLKRLLESVDVTQSVTEATHIGGHTLDLVLIRQDSQLLQSNSVKAFFSDHGCVHCNLTGYKPKISKSVITYRNFKRIAQTDFAKDIEESLLSRQPAGSLNELVEQYNSTLTGILNKHAHQKTKSMSLRPSVPWIQENVFNAKRKRRRLERCWRKTKSLVDRDAFTRQRRVVNDMITAAKSEYYLAQIAECGNDQKALFRVIDALMHRRSKPRLPELDSTHDILEMFSNFFISKI